MNNDKRTEYGKTQQNFRKTKTVQSKKINKNHDNSNTYQNIWCYRSVLHSHFPLHSFARNMMIIPYLVTTVYLAVQQAVSGDYSSRTTPAS